MVQAGTLKIANTAALANNSLTIDGGTLDLGGWSRFTLTALAGSGGFIENSSGTMALTFNPSTESDYSGSIVNGEGLVSLIKTGGGTLILCRSRHLHGRDRVSRRKSWKLRQSGRLAATARALRWVRTAARHLHLDPTFARGRHPRARHVGVAPWPRPFGVRPFIAAFFFNVAGTGHHVLMVDVPCRRT